ncbi:hypothetical protein GCM10022393_20330 [Aquimarina addita]|uniref:Uncharacterized protein n=1 Tax=Aquimarina addita TaxID=870485 RepID=A0ABP6UKY2_9FLAO
MIEEVALTKRGKLVKLEFVVNFSQYYDLYSSKFNLKKVKGQTMKD